MQITCHKFRLCGEFC